MLSSGERCKKYAQKYGLCRKQVNYNIDDIVQNWLEGEVIQESQGPEEVKRKLVAIRTGVLSSPNYMEVEFDFERTSDDDVEHCCYLATQRTTWTEETTMEGGLETEESETFTDSFNGLLVPDGGSVGTNKSVHYHQRSGTPPSKGYSCHGCNDLVPLEDSFSERFDQWKICSIMNKSVHYHHRPGKSPSKGYSCHGCDKQDSCMVMIEGAHYHHRSGIPPSNEKPPSKG